MMKHCADIYNELKEISPFLAGMEKSNVFSVPEGYFSALNTLILQVIKDGPFTVLPPSEPHFLNVPEGYFESLPANILKKIKGLETDNASNELKKISLMLYALENENVFSVPKGYFESLPDTIIYTVKPQAKIVSIKKRSKILNYAAAAILSGVVIISALWVSKTSFQHDAQVSKVNTIPSYIKEAEQYKNEQQISEGISELATDDIIKYLEATGTTADDDLLATIIQEKDLPDEEDYLLNENALQSFLNKADSKNTGN